MPSHNLSQIQIGDLQIIGYSVAGEETVIAVPQLDVCFDVGKAPEQIIPINHVLLTHGHIDHSAGIAYYLSHRQFCGQSPGTVLMPKNHIEAVEQIINGWGKLDGSRINANLIAVEPGDEFKIKPNLFVRTFATKHSFGSVGYAVIETKRKLKDEFLGLSSQQIVALKKKNTAIDYEVQTPIVAYLGDTRYFDISKIDCIANSKILIAECTFVVEEHIEKAQAGRHIHVDEFVKMISCAQSEHIIITHLSQRTPIAQAKSVLREKLSKDDYRKITFLMDAKHRQFGSRRF